MDAFLCKPFQMKDIIREYSRVKGAIIKQESSSMGSYLHGKSNIKHISSRFLISAQASKELEHESSSSSGRELYITLLLN